MALISYIRGSVVMMIFNIALLYVYILFNEAVKLSEVVVMAAVSSGS